ncbi:MAG TPA: hypothetical protein VK202_03185 [Bacteroidia bacterium]|nr:hypothetical protein [Bacteroidia bacterium]
MEKVLVSLFAFVLLCSAELTAQVISGPSKQGDTTQVVDEGIAVTPSSIRLFLRPGETITKEIRVSNKTKKVYSFTVAFNDFEMGDNGKPKALDSISKKYALSKWALASPSFFDIQPGAVQKIVLTISIPDDESGKVAGWTIMSIDQVTKREQVLTASTEAKTVALGIIPSFGFGIYVYQNPPDAGVPQLDIMSFAKTSDGKDNEKRLLMNIKSSGNAIGFCQTYIELTNTATGELVKLPVRNFTILPGFERAIYFYLPRTLPKGKYSVIAVVDYGSKEDMKAAELDLTLE